MRIQNATISAIKADIAKAELAVTIKVHLNQDTMATAQELSNYTGEDPTRMDVDLWPHQLRLFNEAGVPPTIVSESDLEDEHNVIIEGEDEIGIDWAKPGGERAVTSTIVGGVISGSATLEPGELPLTEEEKIHLGEVKTEIEGSWENETEEK